MTQYTELIQTIKKQRDFEEWAATAKYIHAHDGAVEIAYNDGRILREKDGKKEWIFPENYKKEEWREQLLTRWRRQ
mgnify:FL=1|tara:strand:- start:1072 stop:1299 length:228 start_codon:yes stop_codon:yes gene_type:complete